MQKSPKQIQLSQSFPRIINTDVSAIKPMFIEAQGQETELASEAESLHCTWNNPAVNDHPLAEWLIKNMMALIK